MKMRGLVPSLGAGGSLIGAAVCALAVFGGVLAFRGDGPATGEANAGDVVVPGRTVRADTAPRSRARTTSIAAVTRSEPAGRRLGTGARPHSSGRLRRVRAPIAPSTPPANAPAPRAGGGARAPAPSGQSPAQPSTPLPEVPAPDVPTGTVQETVDQTRSAVQPVIDATPPAVQAPVNQVADTVEQVAGTADQTVDGVTGLLKP